MKKMLIALEGIDGSGKSSLAHKLQEHYGAKSWITTEPTYHHIGMEIRNIISGKVKVNARVLALLFAADRLEHCEEIVMMMKAYDYIISDRFTMSSYVYQNVQGVESDWILNINKYAMVPDIVLYLKIPVDVALRRIKTHDIFEKKEILQKLYDTYDIMTRRFTKRYHLNTVIIDATNTEYDVLQQAINAIDRWKIFPSTTHP